MINYKIKFITMNFLPGNLYHIYNQGNNKELLFKEDVHYYYFLQLFQSYIIPHCETLAWCLMPNHFHFLIYTDERVEDVKKQGGLILDPVTNGFRKLLSAYAHEFNLKNNRSGALFRPKTKSKCLITDAQLINGINENDYSLTCFNYIHHNPYEAKLVLRHEDWKWSSYRFYAGLRKESICNIGLAKKFNLV